MRDEKVCPSCGGDLVWEGNVLDGALVCRNCQNQPAIEAIDANIKALNNVSALKDEEDAGLMLSGMEKYEQFSGREEGRQSGRTHGMVLRALEVAGRGNMVIILAPGPQVKKLIENILDKLGVQCRHYGLYEVGGGSLRVVPVVNGPRGFMRDAKVFADHTLFECLWGLSVSGWFDEWRSRYEINH